MWIDRKIGVCARSGLWTVYGIIFVASLTWFIYITNADQTYSYFFYFHPPVGIRNRRAGRPRPALSGAAVWLWTKLSGNSFTSQSAGAGNRRIGRIHSHFAVRDYLGRARRISWFHGIMAHCSRTISYCIGTRSPSLVGSLAPFYKTVPTFGGHLLRPLPVHWPLLITLTITAEGGKRGWLRKLAVLFGSVIIAGLLTRFVDAPIRYSNWLTQKRRRSAAVIVVALAAALVPLTVANIHLDRMVQATDRLAARNNRGARVLLHPNLRKNTWPASPLTELKNDWSLTALYQGECAHGAGLKGGEPGVSPVCKME